MSGILSAFLRLSAAKLLAQIAAFAALPIITHLFVPEVIGAAASSLALVAIVATAGTFAYHLSLPVALNKSDLAGLFKITKTLAVATSLSIFVIWAMLADSETALPQALILSIAAFFQMRMALEVQLLVREKDYRPLAIAILINGVLSNVGIAAFGAINASVESYTAGYMLGPLLACAYLKFRFGRTEVLRAPDWVSLISVAKKYIKFPQYSSPTILLNEAGTKLPLILSSLLFGSAAAGIYALVERVTLAPISLLGAAFANIYAGELAAAKRENPSGVMAVFKSAFMAAFALSAAIGAALYFGADLIVALLFSAEWHHGGATELLKIMSILLVLRIIATCVGRVFTILERQEIALVWNISRAASISLAFVLCSWFGVSFQGAILTFCLVSSAIDVCVVALAYYVCKAFSSKSTRKIKQGRLEYEP